MTMLPMPGALGEQFQVPQIDSPQIQMPQTKPKGGMFGGGGKFGLKEALAFGLAGLVARRNPMLLQGLMGGMMQKQQGQREDEQYQQRRNDGMQDWIQRESWKLANEPAQQGTEFERMIAGAGVQPGSPEYAQIMKRMVELKQNPMVMTPYGPMPYSQVAPQAPSAPVGKLTPIDGGPAPQAPGGFPRSY